MANSITDGRTLVDDAEGTIASWVDEAGANMTLNLNTTTFIEGVQSISDRVSGAGALAAIGWDFGSAQDFTGNVFYFWMNMSTPVAMETFANGGLALRFAGATVTDWFEVTLEGTDTYGGGWKMFVVDIDRASANPDRTNGTIPAASSIQHVIGIFRSQANVPGSDDNIFADAMWRLPASTPGINVNGDNAGVPWTWADIASESDTNAWGTATEVDGVVFLNTPINFGDDEATDADAFSDTGTVVVWQDNLVKDNFYGLSSAANAAQTATFQLGTKIGTGATATGVNGGSILTGGPRWFLNFDNANFDSYGMYGVSLQGLGDNSFDNGENEWLSCVLVDCAPDGIEITGGSTGVTFLSCFFADAPGPSAQLIWTNETDPATTQFDFNGFTGMAWFAMEIGAGMTGNFSFSMRENFFTNNGSGRDILASNDVGDLTVNSSAASLPTGTNGATHIITMAGTPDVWLYSVATWDEVDQTDAYAGVNTTSVTGAYAQLQHNVYSADDDSLSVAVARVPGVSETLFDQAGDTYDDDLSFDKDIDFLSARFGKDNLTPSTTQREQDPSHSEVETETNQIIMEVQAAVTSTPVSQLGPVLPSGVSLMRPWKRVTGGATDTFAYGAGNDTDNNARRSFIVIVALDATAAADTAVTSVVINTGGGTTGWDATMNALDDNTGGGGSTSALRTSILDLANDTGGADLGQGGTLLIQNTVDIEVNGVTEFASVTMEATSGGDLAVGTAIGGFPLPANASGVAATTHPFTNPQPVVIRARYSGAPLAAVQEDNSGAPDFADFTTEANDSTAGNVILMPATEAANDAFYAGYLQEVDKIRFEIDTARAGTWSLTWEYWNGSWTALSNVVDGTNDFSQSGKVTFTKPTDSVAVNRASQGSPTSTPLHFIRARISSFTSAGAGPTATKLNGNPTKYLPFVGTASIESDGLTVPAVWVEDTIAR